MRDEPAVPRLQDEDEDDSDRRYAEEEGEDRIEKKSVDHPYSVYSVFQEPERRKSAI
jgi:hypothetical protein